MTHRLNMFRSYNFYYSIARVCLVLIYNLIFCNYSQALNGWFDTFFISVKIKQTYTLKSVQEAANFDKNQL